MCLYYAALNHSCQQFNVTLVECPRVHKGVRQELAQFVALNVVVQHPEALVTKKARVAWSKLVVGSKPSGELEQSVLTI